MPELTDWYLAQTFFSLAPNYLSSGDTLTITPEALPPLFNTGEPLTLDLLEVDDQGQNPHAVARFKVQVLAGAVFSQIRRVELPGEQDGDHEAAQPKADVSLKGHTLPFETTWKRAELVIRFRGLDEEHRVVVRTPRTEGSVVYELGVQVKTQAGELVFDSGEQFVTLDAWPAMVHNCAAAVRTQLEGHHYLIETHDAGDYFGSESGLGGGGRKVTDCTTFCLQVLRRAYEELGAPEEKAIFKGAQQSGSHFAKAAKKAGWGLVYCLGDKAEHDGTEKEYQDPYWRICERAIDDQVFKTFGSEGVICDVPLDEVVCGYYGDSSEVAATSRYDEYGDVPFFLVALTLGDHMSMKVEGDVVYECHWDQGPRDTNLFDRQSKTWSGLKDYGYFYLVVPPPYLYLESFPGKTTDERKAQLEPVWGEICQYTGAWRPSDTAADDWGDDELEDDGDGD